MEVEKMALSYVIGLGIGWVIVIAGYIFDKMVDLYEHSTM